MIGSHYQCPVVKCAGQVLGRGAIDDIPMGKKARKARIEGHITIGAGHELVVGTPKKIKGEPDIDRCTVGVIDRQVRGCAISSRVNGGGEAIRDVCRGIHYITGRTCPDVRDLT